MHIGIERLRAGEHHVLQTLCAPPESDVVVLTDSPWLPVLRGELRLFSGGVSFTTARHGPHVLPFRIHLAAVGTLDMSASDGQRGLLLLRQKVDSHAYGPLAHLPRSFGASLPDAEALKDGTAKPRALSLAIVLPSGSSLQRAVAGVAWPLWTQLFADCRIPLDSLAAPPEEFLPALAVLQAEERAQVQGDPACG
mmetsp:Transcript_27113/g.69074  ORF Transcript_27113/g.69074 Transcript_27113/m.69074 type:complete len:195 (-) Transcript_27113:553-1137(-)